MLSPARDNPVRQIGALVLLALSTSCLTGQPAEQREIAPDPSQPERAPAPRCAPTSERAIALLEPASVGDDPCGLVVELDEVGELVVRTRPRASDAVEPDTLAHGPAPQTCGPELELCELWGWSDALGPIVFAGVRGPQSEMPVQIHVGFAEGEQLVFVETWYGLPSEVDHTRVGPPWALAPFECNGELLLLPAPRLPEAKAEAPTETLRALAGRWTLDELGVVEPPEVAIEIDPSGCRPLFAALP